MQTNSEYVVKIEKMLYEGKSLARVDGFPIFIENGCPDDIVKVKVTKINKNYCFGEIVEIIEPSKNRVKPICPMHNVCGSCSWQYIDYQTQLNQKILIANETIKNITGKDVEINNIFSSPKTSEYRCKVQYPVSQTKVSKRILSGYYKKNSHELINIKYCPMHSPEISDIVEEIKILFQENDLTAYDEKKHTGLLRHIVVRQSSFNGKILIILVINSQIIDKKLKLIAQKLMQKYPNLTGVCANFNTKKSNVILGRETQVIQGSDYYIEKLDDISYKVSANSFFQVNPLCAKQIFNRVKELIVNNLNNPIILDAYSGVSSFGIWLSDIAQKVICVEEVETATNDAKENLRLNNISNIEIYTGDANKNFQEFIKNGIMFDVSIIDPPRKGCGKEAIDTLIKLTKNYIIYVSCSVSTFARDMNYLAAYGFEPVSIELADMFPHTYHIETIALFKRK